MKNPIKITVIIGLITSFIIAGCSKKDEQVMSVGEQPAIEYRDSDIEKKAYAYQYPLTGLGTNKAINQRIFAVMINNHSIARPQSGLHKADIVFELLAEGSITRYLALFQSELPEVVGPVRSARDYYIHLSDGYGAIFVAYGGSPDAFYLLRDIEVTDYIGGILRRGYADDQFFYRSKSRKAPHNVYTTDQNLIKAAQKRNYSVTQTIEPLLFLSKEDIRELDGDEAKEVVINYFKSYRTSYKYDPDTTKYQRYINDEKSIDLESDITILIDNLLIIEAPHTVIDEEGRRDIQLSSGGRGYLVQRGVVRDIDWENEGGRIIPYINGEKAGFVPGRTWVNVIPSSPGIETMISFGQVSEE